MATRRGEKMYRADGGAEGLSGSERIMAALGRAMSPDKKQNRRRDDSPATMAANRRKTEERIAAEKKRRRKDK